MFRYVTRSGVGVIGWRQSEEVAVATTCAPRDNHRRINSRGRVVRGVVGYGVSGVGSATGTPASITLTAATGTASATGGGVGNATGSLAGIVLSAATGSASAVTVTLGRPVSDNSNTGWVASTGGDLYAMLDEVTPDPLDYISASSVGLICEVALNATAYPGGASQQLKYWASSSTGNSVIVRLKEGATTIRTTTQVLTPTDTEYTIMLTSGDIAAITSGTLSVELESA